MRTPHVLSLAIACLLAACGGADETGAGGGHTVTVTVTVTELQPPVTGTVPCPDNAAERCQAWFGVEHAGILCTAEESADPPLADCNRANAGILPAIWCCPPPPSSGADGGSAFVEPECTEAPCVGFNAQAMCDGFFAGATTSVPHCVSQNAYDCRPKWSHCGVYSPGLVCCND